MIQRQEREVSDACGKVSGAGFAAHAISKVRIDNRVSSSLQFQMFSQEGRILHHLSGQPVHLVLQLYHCMLRTVLIEDYTGTYQSIYPCTYAPEHFRQLLGDQPSLEYSLW